MRDLGKLVLTLDHTSSLEFLDAEDREILDIIAEILSRKEIVREKDIRFMAGQEADVEKAIETLYLSGLIAFNP